MTKADKKKMCGGCRNDIYNQPGNSMTGECWSLKAARVVMKRRVGMWEEPPWTREPERVLSCRTESGYVFVGKDQTQ